MLDREPEGVKRAEEVRTGRGNADVATLGESREEMGAGGEVGFISRVRGDECDVEGLVR